MCCLHDAVTHTHSTWESIVGKSQDKQVEVEFEFEFVFVLPAPRLSQRQRNFNHLESISLYVIDKKTLMRFSIRKLAR